MKRSYSAFLEAVEAVGRDSLEKTKTKAVAVVAELLAGHPEQVLLLILLLLLLHIHLLLLLLHPLQEARLLERLVNKLGEPVRALAGRTMHHLSSVLAK